MKAKPTISPSDRRKPPTAVDAAARARFIAGDREPVGARGLSEAPKSAQGRQEAPDAHGGELRGVTRQDGRELKKLHVYVPLVLAAELRSFCASTGRDQSHVVTEAIRTLLSGQQIKPT